MVWYSDEALEAFAIVVWLLALVLFLVALALPCPLCRRDVKDWSTCCNKCVTSLLGLVFVSHLVTSDEGTLQQPFAQYQRGSTLMPYTPSFPKQGLSGTRGSSPSLHNEGVGRWSWPHVSSTPGKRCTQSPLGCPTIVQETTLPAVVQERPCFHISRHRSNVVLLDITTKVRIRWIRVYKIDSDNDIQTCGYEMG
jgi:hypothetical protein